MRERIEEVIDTVVRPLVEADGGGIEVVRVEGDEVLVRLSAACAGCPGAPFTRGEVIEPALMAALGRVIRVQVERSPTAPGTPSAIRESVPE